MKKYYSIILGFVLATSLVTAQPRIGIAGIYVENSVFVPNRQELVASDVWMPKFLSKDSILGKSAVWLPAVQGWGHGEGPVTKESYDRFIDTVLTKIKENMPYDGFWFFNHGACSVEGIEDPEGYMMKRVREVIGNDCLTTTTMDLHGNVSMNVALYSDLITTFRKAPHDDMIESMRRGVSNLVERLQSGKGRPAYKAWVAVPVLLSGEWTSTRVEPAKSLYEMVPQVEAMPGVIDAGIWIGYVWGNDARNQAVVMVYGDDEDNVRTGAKILAQKFWDVRKQFCLEAPGYELQECLDKAIASDKKPFIISDMGDNPGGGGSGEVTWTLRRVLDRPEFKEPNAKTLLYCSIPSDEMVEKARKAGVGKKVKGYVGAMTDNTYEGPILLEGEVIYVAPKGSPKRNDIAVIKTGSIYIVVGTSTPTPDLSGTGVVPENMDIIMVKQGYLVSRWYDIKGDWVMAFTRGGVDQDFSKLPYTRIVRPIFPLDYDMQDPELNVIMFPSAKHILGR